MDDDAMFAAIADERRQLATVLADLTDEQWAAPSLCAGWTVRDVTAHLVMPLITPMREVVRAVIAARGRVDRANTAVTAAVAQRHGDDLPRLLAEHAEGRFTPPLTGPVAPLTDLLIHGQDIRRPLGLAREFDRTRLVAALDFLSSPRARFFAPSRADVRWCADDIGWAGGRAEAPEVRGPAEAILLARTGRLVAIDDLDGDGVALVTRA